MAINRISRDEFNSYNPARSPMAAVMTDETDWYADDAGNVIGTVLRDRTDSDWAYIIMGRDERGNFRCFALEASIAAEGASRDQLLAAMRKVDASGQIEFAQGHDFVP
jgi:hypothetical protein